MLQRDEFGLERQGKPGDFDILLIPYKDNHILFERTAVFEVKVLRPSIKNPKRNANSLGITQISGLIEDGFPLIGLIHICLTEPLPERDCLELKHFKRPVNLEGSQSKYSSDEYEIVKFDPFPGSAVENQKRRLISFNLPTFVDLYSSSISFNQNGGWTMIENYTVNLDERGGFNPKTKVETIKKIKEHFDCYSNSKYTKVEFTNV